MRVAARYDRSRLSLCTNSRCIRHVAYAGITALPQLHIYLHSDLDSSRSRDDRAVEVCPSFVPSTTMGIE